MGTQGRKIVSSRGMNVEALIKLLNRALSEEWLAYYQYWIGAKVAVGVPRGEVIEELEQHAKEELEHAEKLVERIIQLGGTPVLEPREWYELARCKYMSPKNPDLAAILDQNIKGEQCAIAVYQELIDFAKGKDIVTCHMAIEILEDEVEHEQDLEDLRKDIATLCKCKKK
jgi:bacterioferritin